MRDAKEKEDLSHLQFQAFVNLLQVDVVLKVLKNARGKGLSARNQAIKLFLSRFEFFNYQLPLR